MPFQDIIYFILTLVGAIVAIVVSIAGLFAGIGYYKQGKSQAKSSEVESANATVELFKNRADVLEDDLKKLRSDFEAYKKEVVIKEESHKKTILQQEDLIKTYNAILQNRNPELEAVLKEIRDFLKQLKENKI